MDYTLHAANAWCPQAAQKGEWIKVSKENPAIWTGISLQGRGDVSNWVNSFKLAYTVNGREWKFVNDGNSLAGVYDRSTKRRIIFDKPIYARALKIFP